MRDLASLLVRRKRVLLATFLFVFAVAGLLGLLRSPGYESHMSILVSREILDPPGPADGANQMGSSALTEQEVSAEAELLKSRDLLEQVVRANGLQNARGALPNFLHPRQTEADRVARAVQTLAGQIRLGTRSKSNQIEVTYRSSSPALVSAVLNSLRSLYLGGHAAAYGPSSSQPLLTRQAQSYQTALQDVEAGLRAFGQKQEVPGQNKQNTVMTQEMTAAVTQSHTMEQAIAADEQKIQKEQKQMRVTPQRPAGSQNTQDADPLLQHLQAKLLAAETKRMQFLLKYKPSYPLVRDADQEVAEAKAAIAKAEMNSHLKQTMDGGPTPERLRENLTKDQADLAAQRASLAVNRRSIENMKAQAGKLGEADLEREANAAEQNYLLYLSKREQERTSRASDGARGENVAITVLPATPVLLAHGPAITVLLAFALAALVSFPTAYIVDYFDPTFHTRAQVIDTLGVPIVVALPKRTA
jgi:uncharacterized protein involved in exopolysaccharide biosynthesis